MNGAKGLSNENAVAGSGRLWVLLDQIDSLDALVLNRVYLVEAGPTDLGRLEEALATRGYDRTRLLLSCRRLERLGLLSTISSWELHVNPNWWLTPLVSRLLELHRQRRIALDRQAGPGSRAPASGDSASAGTALSNDQVCRTSTRG